MESKINTELNNLEKALIQNEIWEKMMCVYPIVGGHPDKKVFNLKDVPKYKRMRKIKSLYG